MFKDNIHFLTLNLWQQKQLSTREEYILSQDLQQLQIKKILSVNLLAFILSYINDDIHEKEKC